MNCTAQRNKADAAIVRSPHLPPAPLTCSSRCETGATSFHVIATRNTLEEATRPVLNPHASPVSYVLGPVGLLMLAVKNSISRQLAVSPASTISAGTVRSMNAKSERTSMDPVESSPDSFCRVSPYQHRPRRSLGPSMIANRARTREFRSIHVRKLRDWMVDNAV